MLLLFRQASNEIHPHHHFLITIHHNPLPQKMPTAAPILSSLWNNGSNTSQNHFSNNKQYSNNNILTIFSHSYPFPSIRLVYIHTCKSFKTKGRWNTTSKSFWRWWGSLNVSHSTSTPPSPGNKPLALDSFLVLMKSHLTTRIGYVNSI